MALSALPAATMLFNPDFLSHSSNIHCLYEDTKVRRDVVPTVWNSPWCPTDNQISALNKPTFVKSPGAGSLHKYLEPLQGPYWLDMRLLRTTLHQVRQGFPQVYFYLQVCQGTKYGYENLGMRSH